MSGSSSFLTHQAAYRAAEQRFRDFGGRDSGQTDAEYIEEIEAQVAFLARKINLMNAPQAIEVLPETAAIEQRDQEIDLLMEALQAARAERDRWALKARRFGQENVRLCARLAELEAGGGAPARPQTGR